MNTIYINEDYLGDATEEQAQEMVTLMKGKGWDIEYGDSIYWPFSDGHPESGMPYDLNDEARFDQDWLNCLDILSQRQS